MRKLLLFLTFCGTLPIGILAQDNSANTPQPKPADRQDKSTPALEKPGIAPATPETAPAPTPAKKSPPPASKVDPNSGRVVEEIIARVNNEIITQSEYEKAKVAAADEAKQDCQSHCTPEQLQIAIEDRQKNALRDLIDQSLLVQRGKDMGISVEPDVIKKLDQIRIQNNINSMEDLEKAVSASGVNWEDFKNNIRNGVLTQRVISSEVGSHITIGHDEIEKYYNEHKGEFVRPEQVALRSIEVNTEKKSSEEIVELKKKAETTLKRIKDGEDFGEMAKRFSDGSTAKQGGFLGVYKRGELSKELEDAVFKMRKNDITDVMDTKQGFLILQVLEHYDEGEQTLAKVEPEITDKLYTARMEPAMREYVKTLREQSYVVIKPGFQDIAGGGGNSEIQEVSATPEASKKAKKAHKKYGLFGKKPDTGL
ncbi:MAG TPA: peptidylprolyl isomerase [Methylomirabilota bacterium]|jgi:peptidyl-prolyl cis-trans isomerase SurA|nr:peptidylprolyl isomerase [Methylomirabilota bacterium]